jgi:hypothetical protein
MQAPGIDFYQAGRATQELYRRIPLETKTDAVRLRAAAIRPPRFRRLPVLPTGG